MRQNIQITGRFLGGAVEQHESPEQALKRELMEELNMTTDKFTFYKKKILKKDGIKKEGFFFIVNFTESVEELKLQQTEGNGLGLFKFNETKQLKLAPFCIPLLNNLYEEGYLEY